MNALGRGAIVSLNPENAAIGAQATRVVGEEGNGGFVIITPEGESGFEDELAEGALQEGQSAVHLHAIARAIGLIGQREVNLESALVGGGLQVEVAAPTGEDELNVAKRTGECLGRGGGGGLGGDRVEFHPLRAITQPTVGAANLVENVPRGKDAVSDGQGERSLSAHQGHAGGAQQMGKLIRQKQIGRGDRTRRLRSLLFQLQEGVQGNGNHRAERLQDFQKFGCHCLMAEERQHPNDAILHDQRVSSKPTNLIGDRPVAIANPRFIG